MAERVAVQLPINGELDTANPVTDRPPGTLVEARDVSPRWWGPREGSLAFTRIGEGPGTAMLYNYFDFTQSALPNGSYLKSNFNEDAHRDLGTAFTLDLTFRVTNLTYASSKDCIGLYHFNSDGGDVSLWIGSSAAPDSEAGKIRCAIRTSSARGTPDTAVTFVSSSAISTGTTQEENQHVRVVRNGATATMYLNGVSVGSTSSLVATQGIYGDYGTAAAISFGFTNYVTGSYSTEYPLKGRLYAAVMRDGAYSTAPIEFLPPTSCRARNVHHYFLGRQFSNGTNDHGIDLSRYGAHPRIAVIGSGGGYSIVAANSSAPPAFGMTQGIGTWTTKRGKTVAAVMVGGQLCREYVA